MMTLQERLIANFDYKIAEHSRNAADHQLQADALRKMKDLMERTFREHDKELARQAGEAT